MSDINQLFEGLNEGQKKIVKIMQAIFEEKFQASNVSFEKTKAIEESLSAVVETVSDFKFEVEKLTRKQDYMDNELRSLAYESMAKKVVVTSSSFINQKDLMRNVSESELLSGLDFDITRMK